MQNFKIEKSVKMPSIGATKQRSVIYPFADMEVGDSFFVPVKNSSDIRESRRVYASIRYDASIYRKRNFRNFSVSVRTVEGGYRVWRVS